METLGTVSLFILYCIKTIVLNSAIKKVGPVPLFLLNQTHMFCNSFSVTAQKQAQQKQHLNGHLDGQQHQRLVGSVATVLCHHQTPLATNILNQDQEMSGLTCFEDPLQVTIELPFNLLLPTELQESSTIFYPFSFFGKFTMEREEWKGTCHKRPGKTRSPFSSFGLCSWSLWS